MTQAIMSDSDAARNAFLEDKWYTRIVVNAMGIGLKFTDVGISSGMA